jgi:ABC-type branched-subunit amino acid transport system substrate-binding protein
MGSSGATPGGEALEGARAAAAWKNGRGGAAGRTIEIVPLDDGDDPATAEKRYAEALAAKAEAVVAASTARTVDALAARARKKPGPPLLFVGFVPAPPALVRRDAVFHLGAGAVDQAIHVANMLVLPCRSRKPALVVEDAPPWREMEDALVRNLGDGRAFVGVVRVARERPVGPEALEPLRAANADRLVVAGDPWLLHAVAKARVAAAWPVGLLGCDATLSAASWPVGAAADATGTSSPSSVAPEDSYFVAGSPQRTMGGLPRPLYDALERSTPPGRPVLAYPRTLAAFTAVELLADAAPARAKKKATDADLVAALREQRYGPDESKTPFFDQAGRAALYRWTLWTTSKGGVEPVDPGFLPNDAFGPFLGLRKPTTYRAEPGTKPVFVTFGDAKSRPPRTIDRDLAELGLATRGYEGSLDGFVLDELMARAIGKLHRLFLRNEDGTAVPGVSFAISFTTTMPPDAKGHDVWTMTIAGDDPDAGGRAFPGEVRSEVYSTFLRRTIFQKGALQRRVDHEDLGFMNATHPWKGTRLEHLRADTIRALVDGYAGSFALTGAHELGHVAGLGHDEADPRSIMNVTEGVGLRETQAFFIPAHAEVLERVLGRAPASKERKR